MALDLEFMEAANYDLFSAEIIEVQKMLAGFKRRLQ